MRFCHFLADRLATEFLLFIKKNGALFEGEKKETDENRYIT